jgi:V/A-type H+-transporting ATPase subunit C
VNLLPSASYLDTRLSILAARLLPEKTFETLAGLPPEEGILPQLGVASVTDTDAALGQAGENMLSGALLEDLGIVLRPLTGAARSFFVYWGRRFELFNLKTLIRGKLRGLPASDIEGHLELTPSFAVLPKERLLQTEDVAELLRQLEAGPYGSIARQARRALEEHQDNLAAETAIDRRYFQGLLLQTRLLPDNDRKAVAKLLGTQLDRLNLGWLLRYRFEYQMSPTETYYRLIRGGALLGHERLLQLVELSDREAVLAALPGVLAERLQNARDTFEVESRLETLVCERARAALRYSAPTIGRALAYLLLREAELRRLRAILHGKRLELPIDLIARAARAGAA